jgi:hypothetical protein
LALGKGERATATTETGGCPRTPFTGAPFAQANACVARNRARRGHVATNRSRPSSKRPSRQAAPRGCWPRRQGRIGHALFTCRESFSRLRCQLNPGHGAVRRTSRRERPLPGSPGLIQPATHRATAGPRRPAPRHTAVKPWPAFRADQLRGLDGRARSFGSRFGDFQCFKRFRTTGPSSLEVDLP